MALLFFEGFEGLGGAATNPADALISRRFSISDPNDLFIYAGAYDGGLACRYADTSGSIQYYAGPDSGNVSTVSEKIWGMDIRVLEDWDFITSTKSLFRWVTDTGWFSCALRVYNDGTLTLVNHSSVSQGISRQRAVRQGGWNRIQVKLTCHQSAGTCEVKVNGETVMDLTGIDTAASTNGTSHTRVYCYSPTGSTPAAPYYDNIWIADTAGSTFNDFMGPLTVEAFYPTGDDTLEWTPSTGSTGYEVTDETPPNDDTDYISESTTSNVAIFTTGNLPANADTVYGVRTTADVRLSVGGAESYKQLIESGGIEYPSSIAHDLTLATYVYQADYWGQDPDTSADWTINGVNTAKFGVEMQ
jgi:hypothetical protein